MNIIQFVFRWLPDFLYFRELNLMKQHWLFYKWVKYHFGWAQMTIDYEKVTPYSIEKNQSIFMYWKQGWNNAPELVKKCLESVKRNANGHPIILLDEKNLHKFIKLPDYIEDKYEKGIIPEANYSDMLRICLLLQYGGTWLDATCFLSSPIPEVIDSCSFFMFQRHLFTDWASPVQCSNWFIHSHTNSRILTMVRNWLFQYWKHKSYIINYYMFHFALSLIVSEDKECKKIWSNMPYVCNMNPHVLLFSFSRKYTPEYYQFIKDSCFIHKLSYKFDKKLLESEENNILKHFLEK